MSKCRYCDTRMKRHGESPWWPISRAEFVSLVERHRDPLGGSVTLPDHPGRDGHPGDIRPWPGLAANVTPASVDGW